jgi:hypothetical protein
LFSLIIGQNQPTQKRTHPHGDHRGTCGLRFGTAVSCLCTRSASENRNHAAACESISRAGRREGAASPRRAAL